MKAMKAKDKNYLASKINNEGFDYCFVHYSSFEEIKDETFHELRKEYLAARKSFFDYLINEGVEIDE